jgi:uncharacterized repeat protein (TIGR01451 family)
MQMISTRRGIGAGVALMVAVVALAAFMAIRAVFAAEVPTNNEFTVDSLSGGAVDASTSVGVGSGVQFDVSITAAPDAYSAYQANVWFNPSILAWDGNAVIETNVGGATLCGGGTVGAFSLYDGCARISGTSNATGVAFTWGVDCIAPGTSPLHLASNTEAGGVATGTNFAINGGADVGVPLTVDGEVVCTLPITKSVVPGPNVAAPATVTYTVHVGNPTATSLPGHVVTDTVPAALSNVTLVSSTNGALDGCGVIGNTVGCLTAIINEDTAGGWDLVYTADVGTEDAGLGPLCNSAQLDGGEPATACINVLPTNLSVTKTANAASYQAGDPISWTITVSNGAGGSDAGAVTVTDTPTDGWVPSDPLVYALGTLPAGGAPVVIIINGTVDDPNPVDNTCNNDVSVTDDSGAVANASASATCLSKNVRMVKSSDCTNAPTDSGELINLFITVPPTTLDICEWALNVGGDPDGVGAFEFQVKFDNHIFDITIEATNWLYDTGRVPGAVGIGGCAATILTENDIRFGCVSKNPTDTGGNPIITTGNMADGVIAILHVTPKADLVKRITPGNDNGAIRSLLDEGCEFADIWGHPLSTNGLDALGREILLPGVLPGGLIADCADVTITVRILEGDMDTDCDVDVADDQLEASHYGAFFGNLLYDPWWDLEPGLKDGDVDIKDLQKVFGRNGSTCDNPIPAQPPLLQPGDP